MEKIVLDKPCTASWNGMRKTETGRFCQVCTTTVHDYSNKNSEEIAGMISDISSRKICARFNEEHVIILQKQNPQPAAKRFISLALIAVLMFFGCKTKKKTVYGAPRVVDFNEGPHKTEHTKTPGLPSERR